MNRNSLTLLAILALSVSNLFVGISTQNKPLILASAAISAALAVFYIVRELIATRRGDDAPPQAPVGVVARETLTTKIPIWVFVMILFVILPAIMWVLMTVER
ncbi:MAG: hypothetical protein NXH88_00220 [Hyphomonas sp.]|nr:hypothetical protein [Hyphomonas sp.]